MLCVYLIHVYTLYIYTYIYIPLYIYLYTLYTFISIYLSIYLTSFIQDESIEELQLIQAKFPRQSAQFCPAWFYESIIWEQQRLFSYFFCLCLMKVLSLLSVSVSVFPSTQTTRNGTVAGTVSLPQPSSHPSPARNVQSSPLHPSSQLPLLSSPDSER